MAKGITIQSGTPRTLNFEGAKVADGGSANSAGLYAVGNKLYLDGVQIAESADEIGILRKADGLYFGGTKIGSSEPVPPTPQSGLWIPPTQEASTYNKYNYSSIIEAYDDLKDNSSYPGTITKHRYREDGYGDYPLWHYEFVPAGHTKTFYVQACIHGNEKDAPQTLLRIMDIICNHCDEADYSRLRPLRDNVRFIVVPVVSPWGFDHSYMNVPYTDWNGASTYIDDQGNEQPLTMNMNRNMDVVHQYSVSSGNGGNYPYQMAETRHIKHVVESIGAHNIDYAVDYHDGDDVNEHFWFNYNADGVNGVMCRQLLADLIEHEEALIANGGTDYRKPNAAGADSNGWVHPHVADTYGYSTGTNAMWFNFTMGMLGSVCEYIGGFFGYPSISNIGSGGTFTSEMVTRSLRIRANLLIYAYEMINTKGWLINEAADADYFQFDYPISATRNGLRKDGSANSNSNEVVTLPLVYERWDALAQNYPSYVTKSASIGTNKFGDNIYSYTLGSGNKKVLLLGGPMRLDAPHKETEFGIYILAQYLCNDYIVNQSNFLKKIKQDYTIVVIPCIDIRADGSTNADVAALNSNGNGVNTSYSKWRIVEGLCLPTTYGDGCSDVTIFKAWIAANADAIALISGGEDTNAYLYEFKKYSSDIMTQFILPLNQQTPQWLDGYCDWLEDVRGEDAPDVDNTNGMTSGDYAFDNYGIPTYYINLKVSQMWAERQQYMQTGDSADKYMYRTYETGRRIANIANFILMIGGDIL